MFAMSSPMKRVCVTVSSDCRACALLFVYACACPVQVTEPAKALLDAGEEIPYDLMANILKFLLLQIKADDQQRREAEQVSVFHRICESKC